MKIRIKKLNSAAILPSYGSAGAAGADLYALLDGATPVAAGETLLIKTGIAMEIPDGYVGLVYARSGLATKKGLAPANKVGVIDCDYRGEIMVPVYNQSSKAQYIEPGERIAQIIITPYMNADFELSDELDGTERSDSGFGSTGRK